MNHHNLKLIDENHHGAAGSESQPPTSSIGDTSLSVFVSRDPRVVKERGWHAIAPAASEGLLRLARELTRCVRSEYFRATLDAELPAPRADAVFMVRTLESACESSPEGFARSCDGLQGIVDPQKRAAD